MHTCTSVQLDVDVDRDDSSTHSGDVHVSSYDFPKRRWHMIIVYHFATPEFSILLPVSLRSRVLAYFPA